MKEGDEDQKDQKDEKLATDPSKKELEPVEETETEEQPTNRMIVKDMKGMQAMFRSVPR